MGKTIDGLGATRAGRRFEVLEADGSWREVPLEQILRWNVFRLYDPDGSPVRHLDASDGCPIYVALESTRRECAHDGIHVHVDAVPIWGASYSEGYEAHMEVDQDRPSQELTRVAIGQEALAQMTGDTARRDALAAEIVDAHGALNELEPGPFGRLAERIRGALRKRDADRNNWQVRLEQVTTQACACHGLPPDDPDCCVACRIFADVMGRRRG